MSNIAVTHADSGLVRASVVRTERVTPHVIRVTLGGGDLGRFLFQGFDQWFRLAIPVRGDERLDNLPQRFGMGGALRYFTLPKGTRPAIRNYTVRQFRRGPLEMDIDFVVHGDAGIAAPWAATVEPGAEVAFIDQGCGWRPPPADRYTIVADESGMAAALGILRDMPRDARGDALIEVFDKDDRQADEAPDRVTVRWLVRSPRDAPGALALPALRDLALPGSVYAFAVGEQALASGARRHLVNERSVPKSHVTFSGYWRIGKASLG